MTSLAANEKNIKINFLIMPILILQLVAGLGAAGLCSAAVVCG